MRGVTGKQRRYLRALGQRLGATLHVGHEGVSEAVVGQADAQLDAHELVKVRVGDNAPEGRHATAEELARRTGAHLAQVLGRTALLYRPRREGPTIVLPPGEQQEQAAAEAAIQGRLSDNLAPSRPG